MANNDVLRDLIREELLKIIKEQMNQPLDEPAQPTPTNSEPTIESSMVENYEKTSLTNTIPQADNLEKLISDAPFESQPSQVTEKIPISTTPNPEPPPEPMSDGSAGGPSLPDRDPSDEPPHHDVEHIPSAPFDEWQRYEKSQYNMSEYLESEWDHKSWMLGTKFFDKEVIKLHELVLKELSLSNLPDAELAFIYSVKMDCIEEWLSMGLTDLAKQRLVHMLFRLRLLTSIDGLELVGQHGTSAISMSMDRPETQRAMMEEGEQEQKKPRLGLGAITNRLKGMTK